MSVPLENVKFSNTISFTPEPLNSKVTFALTNPPLRLKNGTFLVDIPETALADAIADVPILDPIGNVAPEAAIAIVPDPSDEIVAPPKSIVAADNHIFFHLNELLPNS